MKYHCLDWTTEETLLGQDIVLTKDNKHPSFKVISYGRTEDGKSVAVTFVGYKPYFFVKLPREAWDDKKVAKKIFKQEVNNIQWEENTSLSFTYTYNESITTGKVYPKRCISIDAKDDESKKTTKWVDAFSDHLFNTELVYFKDMWGFNHEKLFPFMKLSFKSETLLKKFRRYYETPEKAQDWKVYMGYDPLLMFFHSQKIDPAGWIEIPDDKCRFKTDSESRNTICDIEFNATYFNIIPVKSIQIAPFKTCSFDIECMSLSGGFPCAKRDYKSMAQALVLHKAFENIQKIKFLLNDAFNSGQIMPRFYPKKGKVTEEQITRAANILFETAGTVSSTDTTLKSLFTQRILPELKGDPVIQIGAVFHRFGDNNPYKRIVLCYKGTDLFEDDNDEGCKPEVQCFETEAELLMAFGTLITQEDIDIITGYNIMGFDMPYVFERTEELEIKEAWTGCIGKIIGRDFKKIKVHRLASSALGDNILNIWDTGPGIIYVDIMKVVQREWNLDSYKLDDVAWDIMGLRKDDVKPHEIFQLWQGTDKDRSKLAKYCLVDSDLPLKLMNKLSFLANAISMASVTSTIIPWLVMRGQGIKILSLVARECLNEGWLVPNIYMSDSPNEEGYDGAIVFDAVEGLHQKPVITLDYASLYPSSIKSRNICHSTLIIDESFDNIEGVEYHDITYPKYLYVKGNKVENGTETSRFAQSHEGIIPKILGKLLKARKDTRTLMKAKQGTTPENQNVWGIETKGKLICPDTGEVVWDSVGSLTDYKNKFSEFELLVLDGKQLSLKVSANSVYGQTGAPTSKIYLPQLAKATTSEGRNMLLFARQFVEQNKLGIVVYGDTDSVFFTPLKTVDGRTFDNVPIHEQSAEAIKMGKFTEKAIQPHLPGKGQVLEYEKTYCSKNGGGFLIFTKKRYIGLLHEDDPTKGKLKSMGIALKRRDSVPILRKYYQKVIDIIMDTYKPEIAAEWLKKQINDLVENRKDVDMNDFILTKRLKAEYKVSTPHEVLARKMRERDPGNAPQVNDRVKFCWIESSEDKQFMKAEDPDFIKKNDLILDLKYYITNQMMKPLAQIFSVVLESLPGAPTAGFWERKDQELQEKFPDHNKRWDKISDMRIKESARLLFSDALKKLGVSSFEKKEITGEDIEACVADVITDIPEDGVHVGLLVKKEKNSENKVITHAKVIVKHIGSTVCIVEKSRVVKGKGIAFFVDLLASALLKAGNLTKIKGGRIYVPLTMKKLFDSLENVEKQYTKAIEMGSLGNFDLDIFSLRKFHELELTGRWEIKNITKKKEEEFMTS